MKPFDIFSPTLQNILVKLEERDREERNVGLNRLQRLRQIPRETGEFLFQFLTVFVSKFPDFVGLEIGTSGGYSTLWQGMALVINGHGRLISLDHDPKKHQLASENIKQTDVNEYVELIQGDAKISLETLMDEEKLSYVFMDCEKEDYSYFFDLLVDRLTHGTMLIADNVISHAYHLQGFIDRINNDSRVSSVILPIGSGLALLRWI